MKLFPSACALALVSAAVSFAACSTNTVVSGTGAVDGGGGEVDGAVGTESGPPGGGCSSARTQLLLPIAKVSTAEVLVVSDTGGVKTIYVDASAGGQGNAAKNPRVYVDLAAGARVDVTDETALGSTAWDLALKRTVIFTNGGDGGGGQGGAVSLSKPFASVTAADADAATIAAERFFDDDCEPQLDQVGSPNTTFATWYDYDLQTNIPEPRAVTYVVKGGGGKRFKVAIDAYDALADGGSRNNQATGFYLLKVSEL